MPMEKSKPHPLAVSVAGTAVTVEFTVKLVAFVTAKTEVLGGFVVSPAPEIPIPAARLVVLAVLIVGLAVNEQPVSAVPAAVSVKCIDPSPARFGGRGRPALQTQGR